MILRSSSGYCMPFEEPTKQDVQMSLGYGEQKLSLIHISEPTRP